MSADEVTTTLGERIDEARDKKNLSHNDIAAKMQLSRGAIAQWIGNRTSPSLDKVTQLASVLDVDPAWLAFGLNPGEQRIVVKEKIVYRDSPAQPQEAEALLQDNRRPVMADDMVSIPEVEFTGFGSVTEKHLWQVPAADAQLRWRSSPDHAVIVEVEDNMMQPTLMVGDKVVVDRSKTRVWPPGVFAVWNGVAVTFQRLEVIPNSDQQEGGARCVVKYDNKDYSESEAVIAELRIVGRCVGMACKTL